MPVSATRAPSAGEPNRARANSPGVSNPCRCATDQIRAVKTKARGVVMMANGTAKKPTAPTPYVSAGTATNV